MVLKTINHSIVVKILPSLRSNVVGLYPRLQKAQIKEILMRTEVKVAEVDWREVAVYLACTHGQEELDGTGLQDVWRKDGKEWQRR